MGDFENFVVAMTPGGIEAQEAAGQRVLCAKSAQLPKAAGGYRDIDRAIYEAMGIIFHDDADDLFVNVTLPAGWKIQPTDHSMWSNLRDDKGRTRAAIFYKAAFYDRAAHIDPQTRFSYGTRPVGGWDAPRPQTFEGYVSDGETATVFQTDATKPEPDYEPPEAWLAWSTSKDLRSDQAKAWLEAHYPDWQNPLAYWD